MTSTVTIVTSSNLRRVLLLAGILSSIVYFATDIIATLLYPGYSFFSQAVSELFAIGAPTGSLVVPLFTLSSTLLLAFAFGVRISAGQCRALRLLSLMVIGNAVNTLLLWNFFPMHMRGAGLTFTDTMHSILAINPFVSAAIVLGIFAFRSWFRYYSLGTIAVTALLAALSFMYLPQFISLQPTPFFGLFERLSQYANLLWQSMLAVVLLHQVKGTVSVS